MPPTRIPAWPFLVANHEPQRVDYRPIVAPDFLCDQQRSPVLTLLPMPEESTEALFGCVLSYCVGKTTFQIQVLYQVLDRFDPELSDRQIRVLSGLIVPPSVGAGRIVLNDLERGRALYDDAYRRFCQDSLPHSFPVAAAWPLALEPSVGAPPDYLAPCDATLLRSQPYPILPVQRPESDSHPITRRELLRQIKTETSVTRLLRYLRVTPPPA